MTTPRLPAALLLGSLLATAAAAGTPALAADELGLDEIFPGDSLFVLEIDDLAGLGQDFGGTAWGRLWAEPVFDGWRDALERMRGDLSDESLENTGVDVLAIAEQFQGEMGFAVFRLAAESTDAQAEEDDAAISFGFAARVTGDTADAMDGLDALVAKLVEENDLLFKSDDYEDVEIGVLVAADSPDVEARYGFVDDWLLFAMTDTRLIGDEPFLDLVDGLLGQSDEVLADSEVYGASLAGRSSGGVRVFGDLLGVARHGLALMAEAEQDEFLGALDQFDEDAQLAVAGSLAAQPDSVDLALELSGSALQAEDGYSAMMQEQDAHAADWMPPEAWLSFSMQFDAGLYYDSMLDTLSAEDPAAAMELVTGMADAEEMLGFHPRDDLMELLDGQFGLFASEVPAEEQLAMLGTETPQGFALLASLTDGEAFSALLDGVVRNQGFHAARRRESFEGFDVYVIPIPPFVNIAYAVAGDVFVISTAASLVQDVLRRLAHDELPSLSDGEAWQARAARLPESRSLLVHVDAGLLLKTLRDSARQAQAGLASLTPEQRQAREAGWLADVDLPDDALIDEHIVGPLLLGVGMGAEGGATRMHLTAP